MKFQSKTIMNNPTQMIETVIKEEKKIFGEAKSQTVAPGWPGIPAKWINSAKSAVGTAANPASRTWFTISKGIITEVYYPRVDQACTRDMEFIVTDGKDFFSEEKTDTNHHVEYMADGVPAIKIINTCKHGNYQIVKEIITDPNSASILQRVNIYPLKKKLKDLKLFALISPHLGNTGSGNNAYAGNHKGKNMLFAEHKGLALAMSCSVNWKKCSVGFVGFSDGWQDLNKHKHMAWQFQQAENGNVALMGEVNLSEVPADGFVVSISFGNNIAEAGQRALASSFDNFEDIKENFIQEWQKWQENLYSIKGLKKDTITEYLISAAVLKTHESKRKTGGLIASLSIPWGGTKGDEEYGGYHLVWPRDLVEIAGGLLAIGAFEDTRKSIDYLMLTQEFDGHWPQNMWLDGTVYWDGVQMDQTALPILLVDLANREGALKQGDLYRYWPMVQKAAQYIVCNGPRTPQCRWEENAGYSVYTIATEIAALLVAAEIADHNDEKFMANYLRETADYWNGNIEKWTYVTQTNLSKKIGVDGYYIRIAPKEMFDESIPDGDITQIVNRLAGENMVSARELISPDAIALVRFGLRSANDPKILNTLKAIDALLKAETPAGDCWYRYNGDGYGEHKDGSPFNGTGIGRLWPLLAGERGHYEVAAGNISYAMELLDSMEKSTNEGGMIPEQIWDSEDIPEKDLFKGKATGAAMPLAWAHAEYIKLCRSVKTKKIFDMPTQTWERYVQNKHVSNFEVFRFSDKIKTIHPGKKLRIETMADASIRWTFDNWNVTYNSPVKNTELGIYYVDLATENIKPGSKIEFTFYWIDSDKWENENFVILVD